MEATTYESTIFEQMKAYCLERHIETYYEFCRDCAYHNHEWFSIATGKNGEYVLSRYFSDLQDKLQSENAKESR